MKGLLICCWEGRVFGARGGTAIIFAFALFFRVFGYFGKKNAWKKNIVMLNLFRNFQFPLRSNSSALSHRWSNVYAKENFARWAKIENERESRVSSDTERRRNSILRYLNTSQLRVMYERGGSADVRPLYVYFCHLLSSARLLQKFECHLPAASRNAHTSQFIPTLRVSVRHILRGWFAFFGKYICIHMCQHCWGAASSSKFRLIRLLYAWTVLFASTKVSRNDRVRHDGLLGRRRCEAFDRWSVLFLESSVFVITSAVKSCVREISRTSAFMNLYRWVILIHGSPLDWDTSRKWSPGKLCRDQHPMHSMRKRSISPVRMQVR